MPASASLSALALGEGDVEGEWRHSQETRFHCRETRTVSPSAAMPLIVCLYRCAARHGAGARSITFCSASATTGPTS